MAKKDKLKSYKMERRELHDKVINFFNTEENVPYNYKQVSEKVDANPPRLRAMVVELLEQLAIDGFLAEVTPGRFKAVMRSAVEEGIFIRRSNGKNSVDTANDDGSPIFVAERNSMHALNGDRVLVHISAAREGVEPEAEVIKILERKEQVFTGTLQVKKYFSMLVTDSKFLATDIFIPAEKTMGGKTGDKVVVKIIEWPEDANSPVGEVIDVLGEAGSNNAEINAIMAEFGLPYKYPQNVEKAANKISDVISEEEIARRRDMRDVTTFTIDPKDAKDFDDALSIRRLSNGNWEVGVHIADVSYYVKPGSIIDKEAESRGTSVYLVDRVVPMLPERLCNEICSLRPDEDKLTFSCVFELNGNAEVQKSHIARTVIRSNRRFAYEEAQEVIETGEGDYKEEILALNDLAQKLRKRRFDNGSINFDRHEVKFDIDESGKPIGVYFKVSKEANKLIEEFMLLANRTVAEFIGKPKDGKKPKAFVYRVHDLPDPDKMASFAAFITRFGYKIKTEGSKADLSKGINSLLANVQGKPEENLVETIAIRAMAKAVYTTVNIGHYGLSFDYYTHFTSPIRRYPDLMVHRLLERYMAGGRSVNVQSLEDECKHASDMEQLAANAERASIKYKQVEFMGERLGEEYDGVISGITEWGLYVEINENKCEGLVPIRDLEDDYYEFDEKNYCLMGRRKHRIYRLGDPIRIKVARANLERKQLDFALVE